MENKTYADQLREQYGAEAIKEREQAEKPYAFGQIAADAENAVKADAAVAFQKGQKSIEGYLVRINSYDADIVYALRPQHPAEQTSMTSVCHLRLDRLARLDRGILQPDYYMNWHEYESEPTSAAEREEICAMVRERIDALGFSRCEVRIDSFPFTRKATKKNLFGKEVEKWVKDGNGFLLWIKVVF